MNIEEVPLGIGLAVALVGAGHDLFVVDGDVGTELADLVPHGLEPAHAPGTEPDRISESNARRPQKEPFRRGAVFHGTTA